MGKVALITGIGGQDGSYLAELLLEKGYSVIGIVRRCSVANTDRIKHLLDKLIIAEGDITDASFINQVISRYKPDEIYSLAAMSHVGSSFSTPSSTFIMDAVGPLNILEAVRLFSKHSKVYQASTSELYGNSMSRIEDGVRYNGLVEFNAAGTAEVDYRIFQDELTPFHPNSPYAVAKLAAHNLIRLYRDSYGIFACGGILFNHESPRRGEQFVTRKITKWIGDNFLPQYNYFNIYDDNQNLKTPVYDYMQPAVIMDIDWKSVDAVAIKPTGYAPRPGIGKLKLGNINAYRDWGHAKDYVKAMWLMLQQDEPIDYVVSMDEVHTVEDFLKIAFSHVGANYKDYIEIDKSFFRPCEVPFLRGKSSMIRQALGWKPEYTYESLVKEMVESDLNGKA